LASEVEARGVSVSHGRKLSDALVCARAGERSMAVVKVDATVIMSPAAKKMKESRRGTAKYDRSITVNHRMCLSMYLSL